MIEAVYDKSKHSLTLTGHAQSGDKGHDLVCSAASILVYTLAADVEQLAADHTRVRRPRISLKDGRAEIACSPVHGMHAVTELVFDSVCVGFELLSRQYPQNISYTVRGDRETRGKKDTMQT